jgi:aspartyl-tRNA(Asn)/glutamyl-tRNA(Gln) amidotransferase subunit B
MSEPQQYETVVGLEIHARLRTQSKLFCGDSIAFGDEPNTHVSPITLAHPGTLPKMNKKAIELAVKMGLACHCSIVKHNYFARKNYFYPDLPKGYQVSQHTTPICSGGYIMIETNANGEPVKKNIRLNRIHMEEDAGKSLHDADPVNTSIDYNRAGTALIEIVSEPDISNGEEAFAYLAQVRQLLRYLDVCDGNMEEGSLRCDVNISVRKKGATELGTKVEVKNLNSLRNVKLAVEAESKRLISIIEQGGKVAQETRSFDANTGTSFATREKEDADDYRYFAEPDLTPFQLQDEFIERIRKDIPALPAERIAKYTSVFGLSIYDATVLTEEKELADYFEKVVEAASIKPKSAANWMLGPVKTWMNENLAGITAFLLTPGQLANLISLVEQNKLSFSVASTKLFSLLLKEPEKHPFQLAEQENLLQQSDESAIGPIIEKVLTKFADKVTEYKKGKKGLLALFVGEVIKQSKGKADPKVTSQLLEEKLKA